MEKIPELTPAVQIYSTGLNTVFTPFSSSPVFFLTPLIRLCQSFQLQTTTAQHERSQAFNYLHSDSHISQSLFYNLTRGIIIHSAHSSDRSTNGHHMLQETEVTEVGKIPMLLKDLNLCVDR